MESLKLFLKLLDKVGYPNPAVESIAAHADYDIDEFLYDLKNHIGQDGAFKFCKNAIEKLEANDGTIMIEFGDDEYVVAKIFLINHSYSDYPNEIGADVEYIESRILSPDENNEGVLIYKTIDEIAEEADSAQFSDYQETKDIIDEEINLYVKKRCGFGLNFFI